MVIIIVEKSNLNITLKFFDKIKNKRKNITTNRGIKKTVIASQGIFGYIKVNKLTILIEGSISKNVKNIFYET